VRTAITRRRLLPVVASILVAGLGTLSVPATAWASDPTPVQEPTEPVDPTAALCLARTQATSYTVSGGPFSGGTNLTWSVTKGCPEVVVRLNNGTVAAQGSTVVDPAVTTPYQLTATVGTKMTALGSHAVLGGDVKNWAWTPRWGLTPDSQTDPAVAEARRITARITGALTPQARSRLVGREIEVNLIPWNANVADLPYFGHLDRAPDTRGVELSGVVGGNVYAVAVGEETLTAHPYRDSDNKLGYTLAHELGHLALDFAFATEQANVQAAHQAVTSDPGRVWLGDHPWLSASSSVRTHLRSWHEHFAEATAAYYGYEREQYGSVVYTPQWLAVNEPEMHAILQRQFQG
jgi:hypothetical protein